MSELPHVSFIPWKQVAYLPPDIKAEVETELASLGYILIHNPFGSVYVNRFNRQHPDYKLSEAFLADRAEEQTAIAARKALKGRIEAFIVANKVNQPMGEEIATNMQSLFYPYSDTPQISMIGYFINHYSLYQLPDAATYEAYRAFCKLSNITVDNQKLCDFVPFHSAWYENEKTKQNAEVLTTTLEQALNDGNTHLACNILMRSNSCSYDKAREMVANMVKLRELQKRSPKWVKAE